MQLLNFVFLFAISWNVRADIHNNEVDKCNLPTNLIQEIAGYQPIANKIINSLKYGEHKNSTYELLSLFIDTFGNRITGSKNLENAIDWVLDKSKSLNLENVHGENASVVHWIRGNESAYLIEPRYQKLAMLGLGGSIGTPPAGITAEVVVVDTFAELKKMGQKISGKIVVFNEKWTGYGSTVQYRSHGAAKAAALGAVAVLVASVAPFSLNTPHTGWQDYEDDIRMIPAACITKEDAHMLKRMQKRGRNLVINLKMGAKTLWDAMSRNTVVEIQGKSKPEKVVVVSGHLDSWDVGQGAMDDGAGAFLSLNSLIILKQLGLRPRRTLRAILWTGEEEGLLGAAEYFKAHKADLKNLDFIMESDEGTFNPLGIDYAGPNIGACVLQEVVKLLSPIKADSLKWSPEVGSDITIWISAGIPGASLLNQNEKYFWYHHTDADTMDVEDPEILDRCTAIWAITAYVMADLSFTIPKNISVGT